MITKLLTFHVRRCWIYVSACRKGYNFLRCPLKFYFILDLLVVMEKKQHEICSGFEKEHGFRNSRAFFYSSLFFYFWLCVEIGDASLLMKTSLKFVHVCDFVSVSMWQFVSYFPCARFFLFFAFFLNEKWKWCVNGAKVRMNDVRNWKCQERAKVSAAEIRSSRSFLWSFQFFKIFLSTYG